jgi:hypothetical protein
MWTGKLLNRDYECVYEIEVCCDTEKCVLKESKHPIEYVDEKIVKLDDVEYSRLDMGAVKAVKVTDSDRIHVRIMYLSENQRHECLSDLLAWIRKYGSYKVIEVANNNSVFSNK